MDVNCTLTGCPVILNSTCVFYTGADLAYTDIVTNDNLQTIIQKINTKMQAIGTGTVTNVSVTAGAGISASVSFPTTNPVISITNTAPDQIVTLAAGADIAIAGAYPNFTISYIGGGGGSVLSVTGLNTDNTDPANPIVNISVDGVTVTGDGTPGNPLVAAPAFVSPLTTKGDIFVYSNVDDRLPVGATDGQILQVLAAAAAGLAYSTPTYPSGSGIVGKVIRSDGVNNVYSTFTIPDTYATGDILYSSAPNVLTVLTIGGANTVLHGGVTPSYSAVVEADISLSNNNTNDATAARHGFLPILSNIATQYLNGQGNFATPAGTTNSYLLQSFTAQTSVIVTHNFGTYPAVQVIDSLGALLLPLTVTHTSTSAFTVTFSVSTTGNIIATVGSPQAQTLIQVNASYLVLSTDQIVLETAAGSTVTLPTAIGNSGKIFTITNGSAGIITIDTVLGQLISGQLAQDISPYDSMDVFSNGTDYYIK